MKLLKKSLQLAENVIACKKNSVSHEKIYLNNIVQCLTPLKICIPTYFE